MQSILNKVMAPLVVHHRFNPYYGYDIPINTAPRWYALRMVLFSVGLTLATASLLPCLPVFTNATGQVQKDLIWKIAKYSGLISGGTTLASQAQFLAPSECQIAVQRSWAVIAAVVSTVFLTYGAVAPYAIVKALQINSFVIGAALQWGMERFSKTALQQAITMRAPPSTSWNPILRYHCIKLEEPMTVNLLDLPTYTQENFIAKYTVIPFITSRRLRDLFHSLTYLHALPSRIAIHSCYSERETLSFIFNHQNYYTKIRQMPQTLLPLFRHAATRGSLMAYDTGNAGSTSHFIRALNIACRHHLSHTMEEMGYLQRPAPNGIAPPHDFVVTLLSCWSLEEFPHQMTPLLDEYFQYGSSWLTPEQIRIIARQGRIPHLLRVDSLEDMEVAIEALSWEDHGILDVNALRLQIRAQLNLWKNINNIAFLQASRALQAACPNDEFFRY